MGDTSHLKRKCPRLPSLVSVRHHPGLRRKEDVGAVKESHLRVQKGARAGREVAEPKIDFGEFWQARTVAVRFNDTEAQNMHRRGNQGRVEHEYEGRRDIGEPGSICC